VDVYWRRDAWLRDTIQVEEGEGERTAWVGSDGGRPEVGVQGVQSVSLGWAKQLVIRGADQMGRQVPSKNGTDQLCLCA